MEEEKSRPGDHHEAETIDSSPKGSGASTVTSPSFRQKIPDKIGHYALKRVIAAGGMGVVYEAVQEHPRRTVALKIMKQGIASRSALRRFEYESQILARLRHPGIAQVYEAGMHDDGTGGVPFFAMEYIAGAKDLVEYCMGREMGTRDKLELFARVCDAVHHGHQKGIIHRDLKPANILVDSTGQPKIIDFGVARATDSDQAVTTLQTDVGQLVGTVQYMSPEQIDADPHDIDTRSDVYALGVVLYKTLTEQLPYDVSGTVIYEATRIIREQQPKRISSFNNTLKGDVETIVLHALEKDRDRRYQSAAEMAQDIRRYLSNRTILARPPSVMYQARVFVRRNKVLVGGVIAVFAALVLGIIGTSWQARIASLQRDAAERRFNEVRELGRTFIFDFHDKIRTLDGSIPARELLVTTALKYLDGLSGEARDNPDLQREVASAYDRVGDIRGGIRNPSLGDTGGAMENYRKALEIREAVAVAAPDDLELRHEISSSKIKIGDMLKQSGDVAGALALYEEARQVREELALLDEKYRRQLGIALNTTGDALLDMGQIQQAREHFERSAELARKLVAENPRDEMYRRDLAVVEGRIGDILTEFGDYQGALGHYQEVLRIRESIFRDNPEGRYKRDQAISHFFVGRACLELKDPERAREHLEAFLSSAEEQAGLNPGSSRFTRDLAVAHQTMGRMLLLLGDHAGALEYIQEFQAAILPLWESEPSNTHYRELVAISHELLGEHAEAVGQGDEAIKSYRESLSIFEELVDADPNQVDFKTARARLLHRLGAALAGANDREEGRRRLETAESAFLLLASDQPQRAKVREGLAETRQALSELAGRGP